MQKFSYLYPFLSLVAQGTKRNESHAFEHFLFYNRFHREHGKLQITGR
jgi:hypothetical protein